MWVPLFAQTTSALYLSPVVPLAVAWAWLGAIPSLLSIVSGAVAIAGVIVVQRSSPKLMNVTATGTAAS